MRYQPTVSRWLFRCLGAHLLQSPYNVKAFQIVSARFFAPAGQSPSVESLGFPAPEFVWHFQTSSRRHFVIVHRLFTFRSDCSPSHLHNKKPCLLAVSRVWKFSFDSLPAHLWLFQIRCGGLSAIRFGPKAKRTTLARPAMTCPDIGRDRQRRPNPG